MDDRTAAWQPVVLFCQPIDLTAQLLFLGDDLVIAALCTGCHTRGSTNSPDISRIAGQQPASVASSPTTVRDLLRRAKVERLNGSTDVDEYSAR